MKYSNKTSASPHRFKYAIALTGGIASGKSTVSSLLKLYGFSVIDADKIAHEVLDTQKDKIAEIFGSEYIKEGRVDRKALGKLIFSDKEAKKKLENLLHPIIRKRIEEESRKLERFKIPYFIDIPLFYETKAYPIKETVVVYAPAEQQIKRLVEREGYTPEEAKKRVDAQIDIEEKKRRADYVIDNSKDLKHLQKECEEFIKTIKRKYALEG
ncbi:dephospho-CoA kinase [Nitrosophilus alvini]|uniref:dephospho-CoA kinase n=1 Tax=Nitrosophilus alvini TaxID=2714855 RepID=UPI00190B5B4C|nr:dephospho-CoA kinase [Nitrosophilus alvini]